MPLREEYVIARDILFSLDKEGFFYHTLEKLKKVQFSWRQIYW